MTVTSRKPPAYPNKFAIQTTSAAAPPRAVRASTFIANKPVIATAQANFPNVPINNPINAPAPAFAALRQPLPPTISNNIAPRNGPTTIPGSPKNIPTTTPTNAPRIPFHVAPNFFAPNHVAKKSITTESTINPANTTITAQSALAAPKIHLCNSAAINTNGVLGTPGNTLPATPTAMTSSASEKPIICSSDMPAA